jgi:uncharacterized tellurite resistance protein B-like protein/predicted RNA-binding Zn-ribbon protein involved in translation (DUF1610 family)
MLTLHESVDEVTQVIIFGTKGITTTPEKGVFHCPSCGAGSSFRWRRVRRFFTLYFIPIIPLNRLGEYIECDLCKGTYDLSVLNYDPARLAMDFEAGYQAAVRKVMIAMVMADGQIDRSEAAETCRLYEELTGRPMFPGNVALEASDIEKEGSTVESLLADFVPSLNEHGKEKVFEAAWRVAAADGVMHQSEQVLLGRIADVLGLSAGHRHGLVQLLEQQGKLPEPTAPPPLPGA